MTLAQIKTLIIGILKGWFLNKKILDKISEDELGNLNYNGKSIASEAIYSNEEVSVAISEILNNSNDENIETEESEETTE